MSALLRLMAATATLVEAEIGRGSMMSDYWTYSAVEQAWKGIIASHRPLPNPEVIELLDEAFASIKRPPPLPISRLPDTAAFYWIGVLRVKEQRQEHEARVREWEQQTAEWRARVAEHKQKLYQH